MPEACVDANILLRYLTDEPRELAEGVAALLGLAEKAQLALLVSPLTLAEVVYVLQSVYFAERKEIADRLLQLISAFVLVFLEQQTIEQALSWYRDLPGIHFADAYVAALARARGHGTVMSFDRRLRRIPDVVVLSHPQQIQTRDE
jgi:predicted nucleic acid-binding protein